MFFLMKCLFWLALVYAAILYGIGPLGSFAGGRFEGEKPVRAGAERGAGRDAMALRKVAGAAADSVAGLCAAHAAECFAEAARLTALFDTDAAAGSAHGDGRPLRRSATARDGLPASGETTLSRDVPMPVPDPRRRVQALKLTPKS